MMEDFRSVMKMMMKTFRRESYRVLSSERTTVLGADAMFRVLQLVMAQVNKQGCGEFKVCLSDVLLVWKHLLLDRLHLPPPPCPRPPSYDVILEGFQTFLRVSNTVDLPQVLLMYQQMKVQTDPQEPPSPISLFDFLSGNHGDQEPPTTPHRKPPPHCSQVKMWVRSVFCSYLSLLVNTKDDVALAVTLDVPSRCLGRQAFTDVKHAARDTNMSLFLAVTSFIRAVQLGGRGYAPSEFHPLRKHLKGLTLYVSFMDHLQEILGETPDPRACGTQLVAAIRAVLLKGRVREEEVFVAVEETSLDLKDKMEELHKNIYSEHIRSGISPAQPKSHSVNHSTAYGGRHTVKMLISLLDEEAMTPPSLNKADLLSEVTPVFSGAETTCLISLFRSPEGSTGSSPEPLKTRVQSCVDLLKAKRSDRRVQSQFSITYRDHEDHNKNLPLNRVLDFPSSSQTPTCVHPAPKPRPPSAVDTPTAQQEVVLLQRSGNAVKTKMVKDVVAMTTVKGKKRKQTNKDGAEKQPPEKKAVMGGASIKDKKPVKKTQLITVMGGASIKDKKRVKKTQFITGQGTLHSFFRV